MLGSKLLWLVGSLLACYGGVSALVYLGQARLIYFPSAVLVATPDAVGLDYEDVWFDAADGVRLHGWYVPAPNSRATVLMLHGNGGNISHRLDTLKTFRQLGLSTLIFDYRGYGKSAGAPSEDGTYEDAYAAWRYLTEHQARAADIILFGRSLGGAVAAWLAARQNPKALILESTFTSIPDLAAHHYPWLPVRLLARYRYDTIGQLGSVSTPTLVVHSPDDEIVPFSHGQRLFNRLPATRSFLEIQGDHNQGFLLSGATYVRGLGRFLDMLDRPGSPSANSQDAL